jgi:stage II sporulation protein D
MRVWLVALAVLAFPGLAHGGTVFLLDGKGWGHGVGMSQWGAEGYARHGFDYRRILAHYYPHTRIASTTPSDVRVLLQENQPMLRVGSSSPFLVVDARREKVHLSARTVVVRHGFKQLVFPLRFEPGVQPLRLGGAGYRGAIVVKAKPGGLMAVKVLPLDRYLRGVVPWEVPVGWHTQTYEAQAVAARSYTLAMLKPGEDFDLYPDDRSQMYGGIKAERTETNLAIGATAGQVLEFGDTIIPAYYFSSSGGRTSSIHDAWPQMQQVPYLVSVADPYDYLSPHHVWPTAVLTPAQVAAELHVSDVRDLRVVRNSSGRAEAVRALTASGWRQFPGQVIRTRFKLGSTDFDIHAMTLDDLPGRLVYGNHARIQGWVRGLGKARLQELTAAGWQTVRHIQPAPSGHFAVSIPAVRSTELRLAYNGVAGDAVFMQVVPRVSLSARDGDLHALVSPSLPMKVQRLTNSRWRLVASSRGVFNRSLRPGSYRVEVRGGTAYASTVTPPVAVRTQSTGH